MFSPVLLADMAETAAAVIGSLVLPAVGKALGLEPLFDAITSARKRKTEPLPEADPLVRLHKASQEMDSAIDALRAMAKERSETVNALQSSIDALREKEKDLTTTIEGTEGVSKATAEAFAKLVEQKLEGVEQPKRRRDYGLFAAGVIVSALVGIGIEATKPIWEKALHIQTETHSTTENPAGTQPVNKQPDGAH